MPYFPRHFFLRTLAAYAVVFVCAFGASGAFFGLAWLALGALVPVVGDVAAMVIVLTASALITAAGFAWVSVRGARRGDDHD